MTEAIDPKDYRLELKGIPLNSPGFRASSLSLVGPRAREEMGGDEADWVCRRFANIVSCYVHTTFREETTIWVCLPKSRQIRQPFDLIGSILRCFQPKTWKVRDKSWIGDIVLETCTHFTPEIFVGTSSDAPAPVRRRILNECYWSQDPQQAVASMADLPLKFLLVPAIEEVEVSLFLRKEEHAHLEKVLASLFNGSVVRH